MWKKIFLYSGLLILLALFLCRCIISQMRWSDAKANRVFNSKHVKLSIHDTIVDGRHIHYAEAGADSLPALVFIHGSPGSWFHYFRFMCDSDLLKKYRMISFDRPGFGHSNYGEAMHMQDQCKLLLPVLKKLKNDKPMTLCGHSFGGPVVAQLSAEAPDLFQQLVIVAGSLDPGLEEKETWRTIMDNRPMYWFLPGAFQPSNTELLFLKKDLVPLTAELAKIKARVLFVHGDNDDWVPIGNIAYGKKKMINAAAIEADTLKGVGHNLPWDRPEQFKDILLGLNTK